MHQSTLAGLENLFLALSDKTRLRILALMADGEVAVGHLADALGESQPKISRHLAYLRNAGLVATRRNGKWVYYGICTQDDGAISRVLSATLRSILADGGGPGPQDHIPSTADTEPEWRSPNDIYADADMEEWRPSEIEIHLL